MRMRGKAFSHIVHKLVENIQADADTGVLRVRDVQQLVAELDPGLEVVLDVGLDAGGRGAETKEGRERCVNGNTAARGYSAGRQYGDAGRGCER